MTNAAHQNQRPVALVILSGGGFSFETKCLLRTISDDLDFIYLKTEFGGRPGDDAIPYGKAHLVPSFATVTQQSMYRNVNAFLKTFIKVVDLLRRNSVDLVIVVGCSHAIPMLLARRLFRRRTIFAESITRVNRLSNTGKLVYRLRLATTYLVQWPGLQRRFRGVEWGRSCDPYYRRNHHAVRRTA